MIKWKEYGTFLFWIIKFLLLIYYIATLFFRICFMREFDLYHSDLGVIFIEYLVDGFFLFAFFTNLFRWNQNQSVISTRIAELRSHHQISFLVNSSKWTRVITLFDGLLMIAELLPFEAIAYFLGMTYYYRFRLFRLIRMRKYFHYWDKIMESSYELKFFMTRPMQRLWFLVISMMVVAHVFACGFYGMAIRVLKTGFKQNWLTFEGLAELGEDGHTIIEHKSLGYRYLRAMYFSVQTLDTVGFGDIVAHSESETWFCILFFYVSGFLIYACIGNLMTLVANMDSAKTQSLIKLSRFNQYATTRKLPMHLFQRVKSYYDYQFHQLNGFDEQEILSNLPSNILQQIHHHTVRKLLAAFDIFRDLNKGLLNSLCENIESYVFSPDDIIIATDSKVSGLFIIAKGEIELFTAIGEGCSSLTVGEAFGFEALNKSYISLESYRAKSFCEVLFLRGSVYRYILEIYLDKPTILRHQTTVKLSAKKSIRFVRTRKNMVRWKSSALFRTLQDKNFWQKVHQLYLDRIFEPESRFREWWDNVLFCCLLFYVTSIPLLITGTFHSTIISEHLTLLGVGYAVDVFCIIDLIMHAFYFGKIHEGVLLIEKKDITNLFLQQNSLVYHALWIIPFDLFIGFGYDVKLLPTLRLLKLLHVYKFFDYANMFVESIGRLMNTSISFEFSRFIILYLLLFQVCHWAGCFWQVSADMAIEMFHFPESWITKDKSGATGLNMNYDAFYGVVYTRSIYWAVSVMSSIGFPDILPTNPVEYVAIILVMFIGYLIFNTLLGAIGTLISNFNREKREYTAKVEKMRALMEFSLIPSSIETKTIRYFEYLWTRYEGVDENQVLRSLPKTLRSDVIYHVLGPLFNKIPFFHGCSEPIEHFILEMFESRVYIHGDAIMVAGEMGRDMFIIEKGHAVVTSPDKTVIFARLSAGDYAGESSLLESKPRAASVYAIGYVDTYFISNENFERAAEKFPSEYQAIISSIHDTIEEKKKKNESVATSLATKTDGDNEAAVLSENQFDLFPDDPFNRTSFFVEDKEENENEISQIRYVIPLNSTFRLVWDDIIFFAIVYYAIVIPLRIAVQLPLKLFYFDYAIDFLNWIDGFLNFNHFSITKDGKLLTKRDDIRSHYLQTLFPLDLFVFLPYDLFALIVANDSNVHLIYFIRSMLRFPKLFKLLRIGHYHRKIEKTFSLLKINQYIYKVMELTLMLLLVGHWAACGWLILAENVNLGCTGENDDGMSCKYAGTWIEAQHWVGKMTEDGSGPWTRFLRAFNWAIPTITSETIGDTIPVNEKEQLYAFFVMFCGLSVNGTIIGYVVALVADANSEITNLYRRKELLRKFLLQHSISDNLINSAEAYLTYLLTTEGSLIMSREQIFSELPHSLKIAVDKCLKVVPYLRRCPFFDFCSDEVLRGISSKLKIQLYVKGDKIVQEGDLGYEMFFLESGAVNVLSADMKTLYSTLEEGAFFGETALFFKTPRTATIQVASPFCVCLVLSKYDLDNELRSLHYDEDEVLDAFKTLQASNQRRNNAVKQNLIFAKNKRMKLSQLVHIEKDIEKEITISRHHTQYDSLSQTAKRYLLYFRKFYLHPTSFFRFVWDLIGLTFLVYYLFSIPLFIAFIYGSEGMDSPLYHAFEICVNIYWIFDIVFKSYLFSYQLDLVNKKIIIDTEMIWNRYYKSYFWIDLISSVPIEILIVFPSLKAHYLPIYMSRATHLLRVFQINDYAVAVEEHIKERFSIIIDRTTSLLFKAGFAYVLLNHWMACIFFVIHRYAQKNFQNTYVITDNLAQYDPVTGEHNVCSSRITHCYSRSIYFVLGTMTSVGYGDISPQTNNEVLWELAVAIIGAYIAAIFMTFCQTYQMDHDSKHESNCKFKLIEVENYCKYRKLPSSLSAMILSQYTFNYYKYHSFHSSNTSLLSSLSKPLQMEIANQLHANVMNLVPVLRDSNKAIRRRLASKLREQIVLKDACLYTAGDIGQEVFFVYKGEVKVTLSTDTTTLDGFGIYSLQLLLLKQMHHQSMYYPAGHHFGECCLLSKSGLRADTATATTVSEVYYINKDDLWEIFLYTPIEFRREFIYELFTRLHETYYIDIKDREQKIKDWKFSVMESDNENKMLKLHRMAFEILHEILDEIKGTDTFMQLSSKHEKIEDIQTDSPKKTEDIRSVVEVTSGTQSADKVNDGTMSELQGVDNSTIDHTTEQQPSPALQEAVAPSFMQRLTRRMTRIPSSTPFLRKRNSGSPRLSTIAMLSASKKNSVLPLLSSPHQPHTVEESVARKQDFENSCDHLKLFLDAHMQKQKSRSDILQEIDQLFLYSSPANKMRRAFSAESIIMRKRAQSTFRNAPEGEDPSKKRGNDSEDEEIGQHGSKDSHDHESNSRLAELDAHGDSQQVYSFSYQGDAADEGNDEDGSVDNNYDEYDHNQDDDSQDGYQNRHYEGGNDNVSEKSHSNSSGDDEQSPSNQAKSTMAEKKPGNHYRVTINRPFGPRKSKNESLDVEDLESNKNADENQQQVKDNSFSSPERSPNNKLPSNVDGKDILTSLTSVKSKKSGRSWSTKNFPHSPIPKGQVSLVPGMSQRRHSSYITGHELDHFFAFPTNAEEAMDILLDESMKRKDRSMIINHIDPNYLMESPHKTASLSFKSPTSSPGVHASRTNSPEKAGVDNYEEKEEDGIGREFHHLVAQEDSDQSRLSSKVKNRRITNPDHLLHSNHKLIHQIKQKITSKFFSPKVGAKKHNNNSIDSDGTHHQPE